MRSLVQTINHSFRTLSCIALFCSSVTRWSFRLCLFNDRVTGDPLALKFYYPNDPLQSALFSRPSNIRFASVRLQLYFVPPSLVDLFVCVFSSFIHMRYIESLPYLLRPSTTAILIYYTILCTSQKLKFLSNSFVLFCIVKVYCIFNLLTVLLFFILTNTADFTYIRLILLLVLPEWSSLTDTADLISLY